MVLTLKDGCMEKPLFKSTKKEKANAKNIGKKAKMNKCRTFLKKKVAFSYLILYNTS